MKDLTLKRVCKRGPRSGFTILELLAVMAIMLAIMTVGVSSIIGMRRGSEMRAAVGTVRSKISLARQFAVTKRLNTYVTFLSDSTYVISNSIAGSTNSPLLGTTNYLPRGVRFSSGVVSNTIPFAPSGASGVAANYDVAIEERGSGVLTNCVTIRVYGLTGLTSLQ